MSLVSVVIPTRNRASLLREAIESVLAVEKVDFELEIIVVDDGSTDETDSIISQYPVSYVRTSGGLGCGGARNEGIKAAQGDFIAFLDDDDVWLPTNVTPQLRCLQQNPSYGAVLAQVIMTGPDRIPWGDPVPRAPLTSGWIFDDLLNYWPQSAATLIRRAALDTVGTLQVGLHDAEDWDLLLRIARRYPIGRVAEPVALFRQREDNNEIQKYGRMVDTMRIFRQHVRQERLPRRVALQRIYWRHRGWYAGRFLAYAETHARKGEEKRALNSLRYAALASPFHTVRGARKLWVTVGCIMKHRLRDRFVPNRGSGVRDPSL